MAVNTVVAKAVGGTVNYTFLAVNKVAVPQFITGISAITGVVISGIEYRQTMAGLPGQITGQAGPRTAVFTTDTISRMAG